MTHLEPEEAESKASGQEPEPIVPRQPRWIYFYLVYDVVMMSLWCKSGVHSSIERFEVSHPMDDASARPMKLEVFSAINAAASAGS